MDDSHLINIGEIDSFLRGSQKLVVSLKDAPVKDKYDFINKTLSRLSYKSLKRREKKIVVAYIKKITGYKHTQLFALIEKAKSHKLSSKPYKRINPVKIYTGSDIKLLEKTDELHLRLSETATKKILEREFKIFNHKNFQTISNISHSHVTNLRHSLIYKNYWINHTKARQSQIGITMKPENFGRPGSIRVDAVSQKDIYHINSVDEITQWEVVYSVPQITEMHMLKALEEIFDQYPFTIFNFHSDRGHENINYQIADFLQSLLVKQTKSRSYHSTDNALVETKNGSVIRKNMGWEYINQSMVDKINEYYKNFFNPYLNFHRPCGYPTITTDLKGKKRKVYKNYDVPYEKLKALPGGTKYLKPGITFQDLDVIAYKMSDNEFASLMRNEEKRLFEEISKTNNGVSVRMK